jgi:hypothetical protein
VRYYCPAESRGECARPQAAIRISQRARRIDHERISTGFEVWLPHADEATGLHTARGALAYTAGGMAMVAIGIAVGFGCSILLTHSMSSLLYGIGLFDAPSFFATAILLVATALAACAIPARRASRVAPMVALRYE